MTTILLEATEANTYEIVKSLVEEHGRTIRHFVFSDKTKRRFFIHGSTLCQYNYRARNYGRRVIDLPVVVKMVLTKSEEEREYALIKKYRKKAHMASFSNKFIDACKNLPASIEDWVADGSKGLYKYQVTTGCSKDGECISVKSLDQALYGGSPIIQTAIKERRELKSYRHDFRGYEASVQLTSKDGMFFGFLDMEYKGCLNGHYYLLINDESFIYYDKD